MKEKTTTIDSNECIEFMEKTDNILKYCQENGITKIANGSIYSRDEKIQAFKNAKEIYIVATTGFGLLKELAAEALPLALESQATINVIFPMCEDDFLADVAMAECFRDLQDTYTHTRVEQNKSRLNSEKENTYELLREALKRVGEKKEKFLGSITCYNSRTLLRQTVVLVITDENSSWGWINMTMPPFFTGDTMSIAFSGQMVKNRLDDKILRYCNSLMQVAQLGQEQVIPIG